QANPKEIAASTHARVAHARRVPVAIASGTTAAATMPHGANPAPARPAWNCITDANDNDARGCAPNAAASAPSKENDQGASRSAAAALVTIAPPSAPFALCAPPTKGSAMQKATPIAGARRRAGGQTEPATAASKVTVHTRWRRLCLGASSPVARTNAPNTNGASAKQTSGPSSPCQIAFRAIGLAAYTAAAAMPGNDDEANGRRSRYAPYAPSGSAPPTTSACARPG